MEIVIVLHNSNDFYTTVQKFDVNFFWKILMLLLTENTNWSKLKVDKI